MDKINKTYLQIALIYDPTIDNDTIAKNLIQIFYEPLNTQYKILALDMGIRELAYPVHNHDKGHYVVVYYEDYKENCEYYIDDKIRYHSTNILKYKVFQEATATIHTQHIYEDTKMYSTLYECPRAPQSYVITNSTIDFMDVLSGKVKFKKGV